MNSSSSSIAPTHNEPHCLASFSCAPLGNLMSSGGQAQGGTADTRTLQAVPITPELFEPFGQLVAPSDDGKPFNEQDAQLVLNNGTPRCQGGRRWPVATAATAQLLLCAWAAPGQSLCCCTVTGQLAACLYQVLPHAAAAARPLVQPHHVPRERDAVPRRPGALPTLVHRGGATQRQRVQIPRAGGPDGVQGARCCIGAHGRTSRLACDGRGDACTLTPHCLSPGAAWRVYQDEAGHVARR